MSRWTKTQDVCKEVARPSAPAKDPDKGFHYDFGWERALAFHEEVCCEDIFDRHYWIWSDPWRLLALDSLHGGAREYAIENHPNFGAETHGLGEWMRELGQMPTDLL